MTDLKLAHGLGFADLYGSDGLDRIDGLFVDRLGEAGDDLRKGAALNTVQIAEELIRSYMRRAA